MFVQYLFKRVPFLQVCISNKKGCVISLYRSPRQTADEFDLFILNLESLLADISNRNRHFVLITGDFDAKSRNWSTYNTTTSRGAHLDYLMTLYGLNQLIAEPTHVLKQSSTFIGLIFTNQPNFIRDSGIHPTLHPKCHHQIIYSKLNLKTEYPPPQTCEIWDYNRAETDLINRSIETFDWPKFFLGKDVHEQVILFNKTMLNIFYNFTPNKHVMYDGKDPPWMNDEIKTLNKMKYW